MIKENEEFRQGMRLANNELPVPSITQPLPEPVIGHRPVASSSRMLPKIPLRPLSTLAYGTADRPHLLGYIAEAVNLIETKDDTEEMKDGKHKSVHKMFTKMIDLAKTVCGNIADKVRADDSLDHSNTSWGKLPGHYRDDAVALLVQMAQLCNIDMTRSFQNWAPLLFLSGSYHNNFNTRNTTQKNSNNQQQSLTGNGAHPTPSGDASEESDGASTAEERTTAVKRKRQEGSNEHQTSRRKGKGPDRRSNE
ncbi:hypothetical protein G6F56_010532 [Rhizopus delemar]|nr:hypothetical protein G6F56_010532 [Rhizopus delemar]